MQNKLIDARVGGANRVASDFTVKPTVRTASFLVGFSQAASIFLGQGNVRTRTLKAFPEAAYREIIASLG